MQTVSETITLSVSSRGFLARICETRGYGKVADSFVGSRNAVLTRSGLFYPLAPSVCGMGHQRRRVHRISYATFTLRHIGLVWVLLTPFIWRV